MYQDITLTIENRIAHLQINRPKCLNAIRMQTYKDIIAGLKEADQSDDVSVIVVSGANNAFTAGNDLSDLVGDEIQALMECVQGIIETSNAITKPVIAAVEKVAVGIGTTMLLHCDMVIAAEGTRFRVPFANLGVCPEGASSYLLERNVGPKIAAELLMTGRFFSTEEAQQWGFINQTCDKGEAINSAMALAGELLKQPLPSLIATKRLMKKDYIDLIPEISQNELNEFVALLNSDSTQARIKAMLKGA
ncbi:enoyl-CoA hydratase/isomerase family protein [Litoribacillus peritrichatus]|uniref:Enoyl-CoA hydratase-related protein n=1 Tax=Litoribacillus peritrichatus TaxID=718191 RepID=A0ABP7MLQ3_9GAMM